MSKTRLLKIGRIFLSFMFLFSAISKLISIPFFDSMVAELLIGADFYDHPTAMFWTQILTRVLITAELVIGIALMLDYQFKKWVLSSMLIMLLLFTIHLFYESIRQENGFIDGNCGCFGDVLPMNNLESIIKNVVAMLVGIWVWKHYDKHGKAFKPWVLPTLAGVVTLFTLQFGIKSFEPVTKQLSNSLPNVTLPLDSLQAALDTSATSLVQEQVSDSTNEKETTAPAAPQANSTKTTRVEPKPDPIITPPIVNPNQKTIDLLSKYNSFSDGSKIDFNKGTHLICLFSMTCSHCQEVYKEMCGVSSQLPNTYLINFGEQFEQDYFYKQAGDCKHPYNRIDDIIEFKRLLEGDSYPRIMVFKDGQLTKTWNIDSYTKDDFFNYLGIDESQIEEKSGGLDLIQGDSPW